MPTFTFTSPEGKTYNVDGPDGATKEQAFQILQGQIANQPPPTAGQRVLGAVKKAADVVAGPFDAAATIASGAAGQVVGGLAGLGATGVSLVKGEGIDAAMVQGAKTVNDVSQAMYSPPETDTGKALVGAVGKVGQALEAPSKAAGDATLDATGSPALATAAQTGVDALVGVLTGYAPKIAVKGAQVASRAARVAADAALEPIIAKTGGSAALADALADRSAQMKSGPVKDNLDQLSVAIRDATPADAKAMLADVMQKNVVLGGDAQSATRGATRQVASQVVEDAPTAPGLVGQAALDAAKGSLSGKAGLVRKGIDMLMPDASEGAKQAAVLAAKTLGVANLGVGSIGAFLADAAYALGPKLRAVSPEIGASMLVRRTKQLIKEREAVSPNANYGLKEAMNTSVGQSTMGLADMEQE